MKAFLIISGLVLIGAFTAFVSHKKMNKDSDNTEEE